MEIGEGSGAPKREAAPEEGSPPEVNINIQVSRYGAKLTFIRRTDAQFLGTVEFTAASQDAIPILGQHFAAFCAAQPGRIQMPGQMPAGVPIKGLNGGRG